MKIIGLRCDGIRKLQVSELRFKGNGLIPIKGKNKQGKTSLINTIEWLISGNKVLGKSAIGFNKEKAEAEITLGDYKIKRVMTDKTARLEVRNTKTNEVQSGEVQNFLNTFINELTFNPRALSNLTKVEKYKFCMDLYKIDFTAIDKEMAVLEQDRLLTGREVKRFGDLDINEPEAVSEANLETLLTEKKKIEDANQVLRTQVETEKQKQLNEIESFNKEQRKKAEDIKHAKTNADSFADHCNRIETELADLLAKVTDKKNELANAIANHDHYEKLLTELPQPEMEKELFAYAKSPVLQSTEELDKQIQNALVTNKKAEIYKNHLDKKAEKAEKQAEYEAFDSKIKALREKKLDILRSIDTKVSGLTIGEDDLYYDGVGSEDWSDSERMRITSEMCLSMMPNLRALFIDGLEAMDKEARESLAKWAEENDVQIIATIVSDKKAKDETEECFFIEEGKVKVIDPSYEVVND